MPLYMDIHLAPGVKAKDVAEAHRKDLLCQGEYGCNCMTYWIDEERETIFCLIDAVNKDAVKEMHSKAHGLIPNKIIEVSSSIVQSFLGRIYDPEDAFTIEDGLKVFTDPSFRILMITKIADPYLLQHQLGSENASVLISRQNQIIRKNIVSHQGSEVELDSEGFIASFSSASLGAACALAIQKDIPIQDKVLLNLKISINGGEPVEKSQKLFGDTIQLANYLCNIKSDGKIVVASKVRELLIKDLLVKKNNDIMSLSPQDESLLHQLFTTFEKYAQDTSFDTQECCHALAMSQSQLYRKLISLTGLSFNVLLNDYKLEMAKELMKKNQYSISQITFETGFSSPSYFTKCFKKKYGLLPMEYMTIAN